MIYKIKYEHDNGISIATKVAIISSTCTLSTKGEVKSFLYHFIYPKGDDFVKILDYEPIYPDYGNCLVLEANV